MGSNITQRQVIRRLKFALLLYRLSYVLPKWMLSTDTGLCRHFRNTGGREGYLIDILWDLYMGSDSKYIPPRCGFWFPMAKLAPRIGLLARAIEYLENNPNTLTTTK